MKTPLIFASLLLLAACSSAPSDDLAVSWQSEQTSTGEFGEPQMNITLVDADGNVSADEECIGVVSPIDLPEEEHVIDAVRCWWAGGGNDFVATTNPSGDLIVKTRWVDEESGFGEWEAIELQ